MHINTSVAIAVGLLVWLLVTLILSLTSQKYGGSGKKSSNSPSIIEFRRPLADRIAAVMMSLWFVTAPLLFVVIATESPGKGMSEDASWPLFGLAEFICFALGIAIYYASGPNDLFVNLDSRTYRVIYGWPHNPKVQTGPMDDIAGVFALCLRMNEDYRVGIVWKRDWSPGQPRYRPMGWFTRSGRADNFAKEQATALDLPVIEPPSSLKSLLGASSDARNGLP